MTRLSKLAAIAFGTMMLVLSALVAVETIVRKVLRISVGGVDDLSGYAIGVGAATIGWNRQGNSNQPLLGQHAGRFAFEHFASQFGSRCPAE